MTASRRTGGHFLPTLALPMVALGLLGIVPAAGAAPRGQGNKEAAVPTTEEAGREFEQALLEWTREAPPLAFGRGPRGFGGRNGGGFGRGRGALDSVGTARRILADQKYARVRRAAVRFLGTLDDRSWQEVETGLISALRSDRDETVRLEAARALGWGNCCTPKVAVALQLAVSGDTDDGNPGESSERVRKAARVSLDRCLKKLKEREQARPARTARPPKNVAKKKDVEMPSAAAARKELEKILAEQSKDPVLEALNRVANRRNCVGIAATIRKEPKDLPARRAAVRFLGTVDGHFWPEAEGGLISALRTDRVEAIRLEAARTLGKGNCCTRKGLAALRIAAGGSDADGNPAETSARVKKAAQEAFEKCQKLIKENEPPAGRERGS